MSTANAASNSRADRSNIVFMNAMSENVPRDTAGYSESMADTLSFDEKWSATSSAYLDHAPCVAEDSEDEGEREACVALLRRLAYLNQQSDGGALVHRRCGNDLGTDFAENWTR